VTKSTVSERQLKPTLLMHEQLARLFNDVGCILHMSLGGTHLGLDVRVILLHSGPVRKTQSCWPLLEVCQAYILFHLDCCVARQMRNALDRTSGSSCVRQCSLPLAVGGPVCRVAHCFVMGCELTQSILGSDAAVLSRALFAVSMS
jgi:hypothetical protein